MAAAEPMNFRKAVTEGLNCKDLRRVFYGMFRCSPSSKPKGQLGFLRFGHYG